MAKAQVCNTLVQEAKLNLKPRLLMSELSDLTAHDEVPVLAKW